MAIKYTVLEVRNYHNEDDSTITMDTLIKLVDGAVVTSQWYTTTYDDETAGDVDLVAYWDSATAGTAFDAP